MKAIRRLLKKCDFFGVPFSFKYRNEEKYTTSLGGFVSIAYILVVIIAGIYYLIPFLNRKNFSIVYYTMNLPETEQISLKDSKVALAIGLDCYDDERDGTKAEDLLKVDFKFCSFKKNSEGKRTKTTIMLNTHPCNYSDFYNMYNDSFDMLDIGRFQCLDKTDDIIQGLYTDDLFAYYDFTVRSKEDSEDNFNKIDIYLLENECKFSIYYTDITIDIDDYKEPIKPFLNTIFILVNPTLISKANMYFMNQYFEDDNYLFSVVDEKDSTQKTLFSRVEAYSLYKGLNRGVTKPWDYKFYAQSFIRADTKRTIIKRRYQKIMEFYADSSSLLLTLFDVLFLISNFINNFYVNRSLSKKLFFFKDVEDSHFTINRNNKQIKQLIDLIEIQTNKLSKNEIFLLKNNFKMDTNKLGKEVENNNEDIKQISNFKNEQIKEKEIKEKEQVFQKKTDNEIDIQELSMDNKAYEEVKRKQNNINTKTNKKNFEGKRKKVRFVKSRLNKENEMTSGFRLSVGTYNITKQNTKNISEKEEQKSDNIYYSYNIFEIIISPFLCCCKNNKLTFIKNITEKTNNMLNNKLDIVLYIKNTILLDIMNEILINNNNNRANIIKFLSRPVISGNKEEEKNKTENKNIYSEKDFDDFYKESLELIQKSQKLEMEKKLIFLSDIQLKNLVNN